MRTADFDAMDHTDLCKAAAALGLHHSILPDMYSLRKMGKFVVRGHNTLAGTSVRREHVSPDWASIEDTV